MKLFEGDKIKFTYYSNIEPYPVCEGVIKRIYGVGYITKLLGQDFYQIDVEITDVLNEHWSKNELIGRKVRIRNDFDIEKVI